MFKILSISIHFGTAEKKLNMQKCTRLEKDGFGQSINLLIFQVV